MKNNKTIRCLCMYLLLGLFAGQTASAAIATVTVNGMVSGVFEFGNSSGTSGELNSEFTIGEPVTVSYTFDTSVSDSNADSQRGLYFGALIDLSVDFSNQGLGWRSSTPGSLIQTFNDIDQISTVSDQMFLFSNGVVGSSLAGNAPTYLEVDYFDNSVPGAFPAMLSNDAIPTLLDTFGNGSIYLRFEDSSGQTLRAGIRFEAAVVPVPASVWLFLSGLMGLLSLGNKNRQPSVIKKLSA